MSEGPGERSASPGTPGPYEWRSPVDMEFSSVFNRSASSLIYLNMVKKHKNQDKGN